MVRGLVSLAVDAAESIAFLFDFSDPADKLWADQLAEQEAQEEVTEPLSPAARGAIQSLEDALWPQGRAYDGWPDAEFARTQSSAASGAAPVSGSPADGGLPSPAPPTLAGQPAPLSALDLTDAAYAVRGFALTSPVPDGWEALAQRLSAAAAAEL
ncbi:hypothetical protein A5646_03280 [Mycobacterium sp. 1245499.0]|nr:hypothetical protein A5646_03280 [Mycobacterium sp. 1245499.0]